MPNQSTSRILSVATAVPPYCVPQSQAKAFAKSLFEPEFKNFERLLCVFDNTQIQTRYLSQPPEWYGRPHTFRECNALYEREALNLSLSAAAKALARADVSPEQVGMVV
ncbi:MAG TPA: stilbene synthase, partial [Anaerolineae bacterium]|nr:stilbene synthase [Anaerolineae bacterium]